MIRPLYCTLLLLAACSGPESPSARAPRASLNHVYYPYAARTPVDCTKGNDSLAAIVLNIWKGYESGSFAHYAPYFADSLTLVFEDALYTGKKSGVLAAFQKRRSQYSSIQCHLDFWQPVITEDGQQDWILLWGKQERTRHNRSIDNHALQQVWKFNEEGKIYWMQEYTSTFAW